MNKYKVCVYAIAKNEEKNVKKWVAIANGCSFLRKMVNGKD